MVSFGTVHAPLWLTGKALFSKFDVAVNTALDGLISDLDVTEEVVYFALITLVVFSTRLALFLQVSHTVKAEPLLLVQIDTAWLQLK